MNINPLGMSIEQDNDLNPTQQKVCDQQVGWAANHKAGRGNYPDKTYRGRDGHYQVINQRESQWNQAIRGGGNY